MCVWVTGMSLVPGISKGHLNATGDTSLSRTEPFNSYLPLYLPNMGSTTQPLLLPIMYTYPVMKDLFLSCSRREILNFMEILFYLTLFSCFLFLFF